MLFCSVKWMIEEGEIGYRIKSAGSDTYIGHSLGETLGDLSHATGNDHPVEYEIEADSLNRYKYECFSKQLLPHMLIIVTAFRLFIVDRWQHTLVLDLPDSLSDQGTNVLFHHDRGEDGQKWLVLSDVDPDKINLLVIRVDSFR
jgi:hypothetical protein